MNLETLLREFGWVIPVGIGGVLSIIEVSKIKLNPWSAILAWLGDKLMGNLKTEVTEMKKQMGDVRDDVQELRQEHREDEAKAARDRILRFGDEVYQGVHHSKEYFDHILADISAYNRYCECHKDFQNEMTVLTAQHIEETYKKCLKEHRFI